VVFLLRKEAGMFTSGTLNSLALQHSDEWGIQNLYGPQRDRECLSISTSAHTDWSDLWKAMMARRQGFVPDCATLWDDQKHARHYWNTVQQLGESYIHKTLSELTLAPNSRVLDIGAGPGTLAIPLSKSVSQVTAVEPSPGMMAVLEENISHEKTSNIACIRKRWEEIDMDSELMAPFDTVIAAFSLDMPDLRKAVEKMIRVCRGCVYLYWFEGVPTWTAHYAALWPYIHGTPYQPSPKSQVLIGVLNQMGIEPAVEFIPITFPIRFRSLDEAIEEISPEFYVRTDPQRETLIRFLERTLVRKGDSLVLSHFYTALKACWNTTALS
jgi:SAM-dependent methyltransferase